MDLKTALFRLCKRSKKGTPDDDFLSRKLTITPFAGCYGTAGVVVCVEGSPPQATVVVAREHGDIENATIYVLRGFATPFRVTEDKWSNTQWMMRERRVIINDLIHLGVSFR